MSDGLILKNLCVEYKTNKVIYTVIHDLSLRVPKGEILAILGPSGCGKSSLINTLAGTIAKKSGSINFVVNKFSSELNSKIYRIGIIPQKSALLPWKTVEENTVLPIVFRREKVDEAKKSEIFRIYESLDIRGILKKHPNFISGGQAKRASIAQAFIQKPDLLLMDEPFSALDAISREDAWELFFSIWKKYKPITILVTHDIDEALYLGSRIIVMGAHMGEVKYELINPFFANLNPQDVSYLVIKKKLHNELRNDCEV